MRDLWLPFVRICQTPVWHVEWILLLSQPAADASGAGRGQSILGRQHNPLSAPVAHAISRRGLTNSLVDERLDRDGQNDNLHSGRIPNRTNKGAT